MPQDIEVDGGQRFELNLMIIENKFLSVEAHCFVFKFELVGEQMSSQNNNIIQNSSLVAVNQIKKQKNKVFQLYFDSGNNSYLGKYIESLSEVIIEESVLKEDMINNTGIIVDLE